MRTGDSDPQRFRADDGEAVEAATARAVASLLRLEPDEEPGTVVVVTPRSLVESTSEALRSAGVTHQVATARSDLGTGVTVLPVEVVKGLEFDSVVVVEPARLVRESGAGDAEPLRGADPGDPAPRPRPRRGLARFAISLGAAASGAIVRRCGCAAT